MFKAAVISFIFFVLAGAAYAGPQAHAHAQSKKWIEGKSYFAIPDPQPTGYRGKVVVTEVFSFACPGCNHFQPYMNKLSNELPKGAVVRYLPAAWHPSEDWTVFQRAYLTAHALGIDTPESHDGVFHEIWDVGGSLATFYRSTQEFKPASKMPNIKDVGIFYSKYGVSEEDFARSANSPLIDIAMKRADRRIKTLGVRETPTIIIDNKWRVDTTSAGGSQNLVDLTLFLVKKCLAEK